MRLSFISHGIHTEPRATRLGWDKREKKKSLGLVLSGKKTPPRRVGLGRGGKKTSGFRAGAGVACLNLAAHARQAHTSVAPLEARL